jgi:hypothetical protein
MCRRSQPLPVRRAIDLVRTIRTLVGLVTATLVAEWVAATLNHDGWTATTWLLMAGLAISTAATVGVAVRLRRATPILRTSAQLQPDWTADAIAVAEIVAAQLGRTHRFAPSDNWFTLPIRAGEMTYRLGIGSALDRVRQYFARQLPARRSRNLARRFVEVAPTVMVYEPRALGGRSRAA